MKKEEHYVVVFIAIFFVFLTIVSFSGINKTYTLSQFEEQMKEKGYDFDIKSVQSDFIPTTRKRMIIDDKSIDIYIFHNNINMENEAKNIGSNGFSYKSNTRDTTRIINVGWVAPPHFYKKGRIIVQYVGSDQKILTDLKNIFGGQFIGEKEE
jgi:hypothetical protein